jgi:hypothetical protein
MEIPVRDWRARGWQGEPLRGTKIQRAVILAAVGLAWIPVQAHAQTVTSASAQNSTQTNQSPANSSGSVSASVAGESANVTASPTPTTLVDVTGCNGEIFNCEAIAEMRYTFSVSGPGTTVELDVNAFSSTQATSSLAGDSFYYGESLGTLELSNGSQFFGYTQLCSPADDCQPAENAATNFTITVDLGFTETVQLVSQSQINGPGGSIQSEMGMYFTLDPSVVDPSAYTITLSQNAGNSASETSTPEPGTGALMLTAALLAAAPLRRKFRSVQA